PASRIQRLPDLTIKSAPAMKFMFDYLPSVYGQDMPVDRQFELAQAEFRDVAATVRVVDLDPHFVRPGEDSPFAVRPFAERALVVELNDLASLCRYASVSEARSYSSTTRR